ncbi:MAG: LLM class flavin-dependent oxidoreductase [Rhodospirillaceae bacterium]|nr:LLM class flavin-dependent oxidoreductase [Rhodospirillaceae bacterium]
MRAENIRLSVLDQSPIRQGGTPADALSETIRLAQYAEQLGYHRYWLAEHHGTPSLAGASPEIMVTRVAAATNSIRVGSGGVMLSHYSPYKVAENFQLLETMFPGRIDLGIGRAPGSDQRTNQALAYGSQIGIEYFPNKIADLAAFQHDTLTADHSFAGVKATPATTGHPPLWLLGSSDYSAAYAAHFGNAFSFAHFITAHGGDMIVKAYRDQFKPSDMLREPKANLGVFILCADTEEQARRLASSRELARLWRDRGRTVPLPPVEEAMAYEYTDAERRHLMHYRDRNIIGTPEQVREQLVELSTRYGLDEFVVLTICYDFADRVRSYALLAEAFDLKPQN